MPIYVGMRYVWVSVVKPPKKQLKTLYFKLIRIFLDYIFYATEKGGEYKLYNIVKTSSFTPIYYWRNVSVAIFVYYWVGSS